MRRDSAKFVPRVFPIEQGSSVAADLLQEAEMGQNFMEGIITGDKTWVYGYDPSLAVVVPRVSKTEESA
jgi:hypothetical protein